MKDLIQKHFPKKDADGLFPMLESEDEELQTEQDGKPARFKKKKGNHVFEVTPELLR